MGRDLLTVAACLTALSLAGCEQSQATRANPRICADFKTPPATKTATTAAPIDDAAASVDECARRWAYSLAPSRDEAQAVATAVVAACNNALTRWNRQAVELPADGGPAASLTTGELTTPIAEHNSYLRDRALLYVVQARAGACAAPAATNGVPDGVS